VAGPCWASCDRPDAILYCVRAGGDPEELRIVRNEVAVAGIELPAAVAMTRADEADDAARGRLVDAIPDLPVTAVSVLDEASLDAVRTTVWELTGLIAVRLRANGTIEDEPLALHPPATVEDVADTIHHELAASCAGARIWGPSARFEGQRVGREHEVADGDVVEILR
jgi:ribosome-interacting GTPase 1